MKNLCLKDTKRSVLLFILIFVSYALIYMTKNCYSAAMAAIAEEGVMTASETGLIAATFSLVYAVFQLIGGVLSDKFPPQWMIFIGTVGAGIANLLIFFFADNYVAMIIIWSFNAVVQFGIWPSIFRIISSQLKGSHRMRAIFLINMASSFGLVLSYACAALIREWEYNFLVSAITLFVVSAVFIISYEPLRRKMEIEELPDPTPIETASGEGDKRRIGKLTAIIISGVPVFAVINMIHSIINLGIKAIAPTMITASYADVTPALASLLNIIPVLASPVGICLSYIPFIRRIKPPVAMALFLAITTIPLFAITLVGQIPVAFIVAAIASAMLVAGMMSIFFGYVSRHFVRFGCVATVTGLFNCMASVGIFLSNYVLLRIAESFDNGWNVVIWVCIALMAVALLLAVGMIFVWRHFTNKYSHEATE